MFSSSFFILSALIFSSLSFFFCSNIFCFSSFSFFIFSSFSFFSFSFFSFSFLSSFIFLIIFNFLSLCFAVLFSKSLLCDKGLSFIWSLDLPLGVDTLSCFLSKILLKGFGLFNVRERFDFFLDSFSWISNDV